MPRICRKMQRFCVTGKSAKKCHLPHLEKKAKDAKIWQNWKKCQAKKCQKLAQLEKMPKDAIKCQEMTKRRKCAKNMPNLEPNAKIWPQPSKFDEKQKPPQHTIYKPNEPAVKSITPALMCSIRFNELVASTLAIVLVVSIILLSSVKISSEIPSQV